MNITFGIDTAELARSLGLEAGAVESYVRENYDAVTNAGVSAVEGAIRAAGLAPAPVPEEKAPPVATDQAQPAPATGDPSGSRVV